MDNRQLTTLLTFIANCHEVDIRTNAKMDRKCMEDYIHHRFPTLTDTQVKQIQRII